MSAQEQQRTIDKAEMKVKIIENGILVGSGLEGWFTFETWARASEHIGLRIERMQSERKMERPGIDDLNLIDRIKRRTGGTLNAGHGHVWLRPDGLKARCGGAGLCKECYADLEAVREPAI